VNTEFTYCYRDSGNNKIWRTEIFIGSAPDTEKFLECCEDFQTGDKRWFLPHQVCDELPSAVAILSEQGYDYDEEIDGPYLWFGDIEPTTEKATVKMTAMGFLRKFQEAKGKWNESKAKELLGI
jgi:hypothetical protein